MQEVATALSSLAAILVGWMQLPYWTLVPLALFAVYGMRAYDPAVATIRRYIQQFFVALLCLAVLAWLAAAARWYMIG